jgi:hypothetical protein
MPDSYQSPNDQVTPAAAEACCIITRCECVGRSRTRSGSASQSRFEPGPTKSETRPAWQSKGCKDPHLFPGRTERLRLTTRQFGRLFKEAAKAAGLQQRGALSGEARHNYTANLPRGDATQQMNGL